MIGHRLSPNDQARCVQHLFDSKAAGWPAKYAPGAPMASRLAGLSHAAGCFARPGDRVLDLGCGTGELAHALSGWMRVVGCDISAQMLWRAAAIVDGRAGWVLLDPFWRTLPLASGSFDVVVASSVLEYVPEPDVVLLECARVLRPGGVLLCTVPDLRHPVRWAEFFAARLALVTAVPSGRARSYQAYLRASRQRHSHRWWLVTAEHAGLDPEPATVSTIRSPLRLLAFRRACRAWSRR